MKVTIKEYTIRPLDRIAEAAGTSTDRRDTSEKRVRRCFEQGHGAVFEFADVTMFIEGISRACSHQLVRHRMASYCQKSQRYTTLKGDDWYVTPPAALEHDETTIEPRYFQRAMDAYKRNYELALAMGLKPEDARFLLPEATKTAITMKINVRSLFNFLTLRTDKSAQWEIRDLANEIKEKCKGINDQWATLIGLWEDKIKTREGKIKAIIEWFGDEHDPELVREATDYLDQLLRR